MSNIFFAICFRYLHRSSCPHKKRRQCRYNLNIAWAENYIAMYQFLQALELYREAYAFRPKVKETKLMYKILFYFDTIKKSMESNSISLAEKIKSAERLGDLCYKLYDKFHFSRLVIAALGRYTEQLELIKSAGDGEFDASSVHSSIAASYVDLDQIDNAIEHYRQSFK